MFNFSTSGLIKTEVSIAFTCCGKCISEALAHNFSLSQRPLGQSTSNKGKPRQGPTKCYSVIA
jgi:hypothetical protein